MCMRRLSLYDWRSHLSQSYINYRFPKSSTKERELKKWRLGEFLRSLSPLWFYFAAIYWMWLCIYIMFAVPNINISNSLLSIRIESIDNSSTDSMGQRYCETPKWFVCLFINKKKCGSDSNCFFPFISSTKTKMKQIFVKKKRVKNAKSSQTK